MLYESKYGKGKGERILEINSDENNLLMNRCYVRSVFV